MAWSGLIVLSSDKWKEHMRHLVRQETSTLDLAPVSPIVVFYVNATLWLAVEMVYGRGILHRLDLHARVRSSFEYPRAFDAMSEACRLWQSGGGDPSGWQRRATLH